MEAWLQEIFAWLPEGWPYYALLGAIALLESVVGIGLLVPGSVLIVFAGFLAFHGKGDFAPLFGAVTTGALAGDLLSFWLGARMGLSLLQHRLFRRRADLLRHAELFFAAHGGKSVFFGRFLGPLRGFIPFVAGGARMRPGLFIAYTLVSALLWGATYPTLGYLGGASWQQVRQWSGRFGLLMSLLLLLVVLNGLFWKKLAPRLSGWLGHGWAGLKRGWGRLLQRPPLREWIGRHPRLWGFFAARFTLHRGSGLYLTVGFAVSALFAALFLWMAGDIGLFHHLDRQIYERLSEVRHPAADTLLVGIAALSDGVTLLLLGVFVLLWLVLHNRDFSALILLIGLTGGEALLFLIHLFFRPPPPPPLFPDLPAAFTGFPSGHAFTISLFCGLVVYFILGTVNQWRRRLTLVIAGSSLAVLVGFSRIYLGLQWPTSVLAGFALAALWLTFLITAAELRRRYAGEFPWRIGWQPVRLTPLQRTLLLTAAALATAGGIIHHLLRQLGFL